MKFIQNWTIKTDLIPAYPDFSQDFAVPVDYTLAKMMLESDLSTESLEEWKKLVERINPKTNELRVKYAPRYGLGRRYADCPDETSSNYKTHYGSLVKMSRVLKNTIFAYQGWVDYDQVKGHVTILYEIAQRNGKKLPAYETFLTGFDAIALEMIAFYSGEVPLTKRDIKWLFNKTIYGGGIKEWLKSVQAGDPKNNDPPKTLRTTEVYPFYQKFYQETQSLISIVYESNDELQTKVCADETDLWKRKNRVMAYFCGIIENELTFQAYKFACKNKMCKQRRVDWGYDGFTIPPGSEEVDVDKMNEYVRLKTGFKTVTFIRKEYDGVLTDILEKRRLEDTSSHDFSTFPFEHTDMYHQLYCSSLSSSSMESTYQLRKAYIERFMCKVMSPDACFIFQNGEEKEGVIVSEPFVYSAQSLCCLLKPIQSGMFTKWGLPISFYDKWSCDPAQRIYRKYDFVPFVTNPHRTDIFNMFMGFNPVIFGEGESNLTVWFDLCLALCGDNEADAAYFHQFLANLFQEPTKRPPVAIVFKGKQGTGKNMALDTIGNMIGNDHYITSSKPSDFFGDHAEGFYRKLLVNINEAEGKDTFDFEGRIKSFITEPTITVNPKFVRPTNVSNHARLIITTNKPTPIPIDVKSKDRRYVVYETSDRFKQYGSATWTKMYKYFRTPAFMATLYKYYSTLDISQVDWINDRPITKAYRDMCNMFSPTEALFLENYIDSLPEKERQKEFVKNEKSIDLFTEYETFCKSNRFMKENNSPNSRAFIGRLNSLGLPMYQHKEHNAIWWRFVPVDVYAFMTERRWIGDYGQEEIKKEVTVELDANLFG